MSFIERSLPPGDRDEALHAPVLAPPSPPGGSLLLPELEDELAIIEQCVEDARRALLALRIARGRGDWERMRAARDELLAALAPNPRGHALLVSMLISTAGKPKEKAP